jgi:tryptophan 2,3-dioxygenase
MEIEKEIQEKLQLLKEKYAVMGQDLSSYLDGLLHADYLTYWDYVHLDTLLSLQTPRTPFPDETIFIIYHQITELYFKLCLHEFEQIASHPALTAVFMNERVSRINRYFENLTHSFLIMIDGMDRNQFLQYRMSLLPASGFQSAQYRMIEIYATDFIYLIDKDHRYKFQENNKDIKAQFEYIYWKAGATELKSGKKTLTLEQFEKKYSKILIELSEKNILTNVFACYRKLEANGEDLNSLKNSLKKLDVLVNINWPLSHYKSAARYLQKDPEDIKATGGTNWQKYLPPRFQKRIFYPSLWTSEEIENWGKGWVETEVFSK